MSCIHYKFRNHSTYDTVTFDGSSITVGELKQAILGQKKMGRAPDFTLQIINAQTQEEYTGDNTTIPRNADVTVKRVPSGARVSKSQLAAQNNSIDLYKMSETPTPFNVAMEVDLTKTEGTEEDKLKAVMKQQEQAYDQNATTMRMYGRVTKDDDLPPNYVCHRCSKPGHWIKNCPTNGDPSFEQKTNHPSSNYTAGQPYHVRRIALNLRKQPDKVEKSAEEKRKEELSMQESHDKVKSLSEQVYNNIPPEMECPVCKEIMKDSSLISCCGSSFCDECIRDKLLEDAQCPHCWKEEVYPDTIVPNKSLRVSINNYKKQNSDQIAKIYAETHIRPSVAPVVAMPAMPPGEMCSPLVKPKVPSALLPMTSTHSNYYTSHASSHTSSHTSAYSNSKPALPPHGLPPHGLYGALPSLSSVSGNMPAVAILPAMEPPPVAILPPPSTTLSNPIKIESESPTKTKAEDKKQIVPQILPFAPLPVMQNLPMPQMTPYGMLGAMNSGPPGLLPPPLPLPEHLPHPNEKILNENEFYAIQEELRRIRKKRRSNSPNSPTSRPTSRKASPDKGWFKQRELNKRRQTSLDRHKPSRGEDRREKDRPSEHRPSEHRPSEHRPSEHRPSEHSKRSTSPYNKTKKHKAHHKTKRHHKKSHHKRARKESESGSDKESDKESGSASNVESPAGSDVAYPVPTLHTTIPPTAPLISYSDNSRASTPCVRTPTGPGATTPTIRDVLTPEHVETIDKEQSPDRAQSNEPAKTNGVSKEDHSSSSSDTDTGFKEEAKLPLEELRRRFKEKEMEVMKLKSEKAAATERRKHKKNKKQLKESKRREEGRKREEREEMKRRQIEEEAKKKRREEAAVRKAAEERLLARAEEESRVKENKSPEKKKKSKKSKKSKHSHTERSVSKHSHTERSVSPKPSKRKRSPAESSQDSSVTKSKVKHKKSKKSSKPSSSSTILHSLPSKDSDVEIKVKFSPLTIKTSSNDKVSSPVKSDSRKVSVHVSPLKVKTKKDSKKKHKKKVSKHAVSGIEDGEIE